MQVPEFHDGLAPGVTDAITRIQDISDFFRYAEKQAPRLRLLRLQAIERCREAGMTVADIADATGMKEHRINEIWKERNRVRPTAATG
jgi:hypothetical protein